MNLPSAQPALRVLIVDDNVDAADSLAMVLQMYRYEVRVAYEGNVALRAAREYRPDCLLSDIAMPGLDGYALAQAVRAEPDLAGIKLVALTAYSGETHARRADEAGFDYSLTKAGELQELLGVLQMIEEIKALADKTRTLAQQSVDLAGQTKELLQEVKEEIKEVKQEVKELKEGVKALRKKEGQG